MFDEKEILEFWEKNKVFEKSVFKRKGNKKFVFFEGPPTANGRPGVHHVEARSFKDVILRYKAMRGFFVPRRAGWDTHGLPVEVEVEKTLGLKNKKDIEKYGIAEFNKKCRESVWKYKDLWEHLTFRMGFWIDMAHPYITYENSYMESLWGVIREFASKKLLYEDYKVMPWCARCGTALSSHELAQGYEKIKEDSIYIKFKIKGEENTYFLVWTTTPWTLPGNVALAVNPKVDYVAAKVGDEIFILAEAQFSILDKDFQIIKKFKGSELIGKEYEPLYPNSAPYRIIGGDFVSVEEGTGIVHIAPAFGDDDFQLSKKYDLPVLETTDDRGLIQTPGKPWNGKWFKDADPLIAKDLEKRNLLFKTELYEHDYPFCWRCKNPLMYLARKAWWVDVNSVRHKLLENNQKINWHPGHIKDGRMGEWLKEKKNWAFSRERFWGTPLPIWRCLVCKKRETVGSLDELKKSSPTSGNKYFVIRHGESETNLRHITNCTLEQNHYPLTPKGKKQVEASAKLLLKNRLKPDLIFASPFLRTKETAEIVAEKLGVDTQNIKIDPRLGEVNTGIFAEGDPDKYHAHFTNQVEKFTKAPPRGETLTQIKQRVFAAISEIESKYQNKTIFIVSHEYTLWMLWTATEGKTDEESVYEKEVKRKGDFIKTGELQKFEFYSLPRDKNLILDLHKPYIDNVILKCECGGVMKRVPEVCDGWFDSGAMPFAGSPLGFPADYIAEAIDQTRGWFYTLLAVATLLGKGAPYKNVISLGHVLDKSGKKMSKSLGNVVDPMGLIEKYGADAVRWYFFTINQPWDSKLFKEEDIKDVSRRFFMILWNILQFWKLYSGERKGNSPTGRVNVLINRWAIAKLNEVTNFVTKKLDNYDIVGAARDLENFVTEDISRWYIRRIRDVIKENSKEAKARFDSRQARQETSAVLAYLLGEISKLLAPFAPFISEKIWMELLARRSLGVGGGNKNSAHLEDWPSQLAGSIFSRLTLPRSSGGSDASQKLKPARLLENMNEVRKIVGLALEARAKAGIKVRQPLGLLKLNKKHSSLEKDFLALISAEVNIKKIEFDEKLKDEIWLDIAITSELKEESLLRDLIREIQATRKTVGLKPKDKVTAQISLPKEILVVVKKYEKILMKETNLKSLQFSEAPATKILLR